MPDAKEWGIASDIRKILSDDAGNLSSKRVPAVHLGQPRGNPDPAGWRLHRRESNPLTRRRKT